ncbi:MAG: methyltransferase domain-containing protein [Dehalococcoidia bacterium]|nr:methyltransferase domain-containing protein [Dehalococcoidia bacterium]
MAQPAHRESDERWVEVTARVAPADVDLVSAVLEDLAAGGVAVEPAIEVSDEADFEYRETAAPSAVRAYLAAPFEPRQRRALRARLTALPLTAPLPPLHYAEVAPEDWAEEWKRFYSVQHIGKRIVVRPSWERYQPAPGEVVVELDPGTAFGTGQHETTRLCLAAIERHLRPGVEVLDIGAGSGILAVAAAKLGAARVRAIDIDGSTVEVARENAARNGVAGRVLAAAGSLGEAWPWGSSPPVRCAGLVVANISSTVVTGMLADIARALRPGGLLLASGFMAASEAEVVAASERQGLRTIRVDGEGDWRCLVAARAA